MKFSSRARYALRCMITLARLSREDSKPTSLERVSKITQISRRYLEQLVIALKNARLLKGISGKGGGYLLASPAEEIKIGQIIEAAIGPISIVDCIGRPESCLKTDVCECRLVYLLINSRITQVLNEFSLADLADTNALKKITAQIKSSGALNKEEMRTLPTNI